MRSSFDRRRRSLAALALCSLATGCQPEAPPAASPGVAPRSAWITAGTGEGAIAERIEEQGADFPDVAPAMNVRTSVLDALQDRDRRLGLGAAGPMLGIAMRDARRSDTPESIADLQAVVDGSGGVRSVSLLGATGGRDAWEHVAAQMEGDLSGVKLRVPREVEAVVVKIRVVVALRMPSGALVHPTPLFENALKNLGEDEHPPPAAACAGADLPPSGADFFTHRTPSVCPSRGVGGFDLSDLGAKPARVVHAAVLEERIVNSR